MKAETNVSANVFGRVDNRTASLSTHSVIVKQSLLLGVVASCNAALAVLMAWFIVAKVGVNVDSDAFFASSALPQFIFTVLASTLVPVLVPILTVRDGNQLQDDARSFFTFITAAFVVVAIILGVSSFAWVPMVLPGFTTTAKNLTIHLTRIQLASMVLNAMIVTLWTVYHARQKFLWVELSGSIANLCGLVTLLLTLDRFGISAAAWNTVFVNSLKLIFLLPILGSWRGFVWNAIVIRQAWGQMKTLLPGLLYLRTEPWVDRFLASMTGIGSLSLLYVAQQIYANLLLLLAKSVAAPMIPTLAIEARKNNSEGYRRIYHSRLVMMFLVTGFGCLMIVLLWPAFKLLIGHGGITASNVNTVWWVLVLLSGVFIGGALAQVTAGAYYAIENTRTPTKLSVILYSFFIPLKIAAFLRYGILGVAVAMSAFAISNFLVQFFSLRSSLRSLNKLAIRS